MWFDLCLAKLPSRFACVVCFQCRLFQPLWCIVFRRLFQESEILIENAFAVMSAGVLTSAELGIFVRVLVDVDLAHSLS